MESLKPAIWTIVGLAIFLGVGLAILEGLSTNLRENTDYTSSATNETITLDNGVAVSLANTHLSANPSSVLVNATGAWANLGSDNYTMDLEAGTLTLTESAYDTNKSRVTYSYYDEVESFNSTSTMITKMATVPVWAGILIIVMFAAMIMAYMGFKNQS